MTTQQFLDDFAQQLSNSELKLQKLQAELQSEQQLFLKLSGAVEVLRLLVGGVESDVPDYVEPPEVVEDSEFIESEIIDAPALKSVATRKTRR